MADLIVDRIERLFRQRGAAAYLGEAVTVADHMLQCAALARSEGAPDTLVAAALLHDIGHIVGPDTGYSPDDRTDRAHERRGAAFLRDHFPAAVVSPIDLHVAAKRYLCATDPAYFDRLSAASRHSLALQGGAMSTDEARRFEREARWQDAVRVRIWDDAGKATGRAIAPIESYRPLLAALAGAPAA